MINCVSTFADVELSLMMDEVTEIEQTKQQKELEIQNINKDLDKIKLLFEKRQYARTQRENKQATFETINSAKISTRYKRQKESKNALEQEVFSERIPTYRHCFRYLQGEKHQESGEVKTRILE